MKHFVETIEGVVVNRFGPDLYPEGADGERHPAIPAAAFEVSADLFAVVSEPGPWRIENNDAVRVVVAPPAPVAPQLVTMRQARLAMLGAGILDDVEAAIAAMPGEEGKAARIEWEYAATLRRGHPLVTGLGPSLGMDDAAIDALFAAAAAIPE